MTTTFHQLPKYRLVKIGHDWFRVEKNGKGMVVGREANMLEYLDKWARGEFTRADETKADVTSEDRQRLIAEAGRAAVADLDNNRI